MRFTFQNKHEYPLKDFPHVHAETCSVLSTSMGILCCGIKQRGDTVFPSWIHVLQLYIATLYGCIFICSPLYLFLSLSFNKVAEKGAGRSCVCCNAAAATLKVVTI